MLDDSYAASYAELIEDTDWSKFGRGRDPRCADCMAHCGYEPTVVVTVVVTTMGSLRESLRADVGD